MCLFFFLCALFAINQWVVGTHGCLPGETKLFLTSANLDKFPDLSACASTLKVLDVSNNAISSIPTTISSLTMLEELRVSGNQLTTLPNEIGYLSKLKLLSASDNYLRTLPRSLGGLSSIRSLQLARNNFHEFPDSILGLWDLEELDLDNNHISSLPEKLGQLYKMRVASFRGNHLSTIPAEFGMWSNLNTLLVDDNYVTCLPLSVKRLAFFIEGNYLPDCTHTAIKGYFIQESRNNSIDNSVRNMSGIAVGCIDYVRSSCVQNENTVTIARDYLSDFSSLSITCDKKAPVEHYSYDVYPRWDPETGVATTCATISGDSNPAYPPREPGMTTARFANFDTCIQDYEHHIIAEIRPQDKVISEAGAVKAQATKSNQFEDTIRSVHNPYQFHWHSNLPTFKAAAAARANQREEDERADVLKRFAAQKFENCTQDGFDGELILAFPKLFDFTGCVNNLRKLTIYHSFDMGYFANHVLNLRHLQELHIYGARGELPDTLDLLPELTTLSCFYCNFPVLPEVIRRMPALTSFSYSTNYAPRDLPEWFSELTQLTYLDLSNTHFGWRRAIEKLANLEHLMLGRASLHTIPSAGFRHLTKLRTLDLSDNFISRLPGSVGHLRQLEQLNLMNTVVQCLPQEVRDLPNLQNSTAVQHFSVCPKVALPIVFVRNRAIPCRDALVSSVGYCTPDAMQGTVANGTATTYSTQYCHRN